MISNWNAVAPKIANLSLQPALTNTGRVALQESQIFAICNCVGFPSPAISWECSEPFDGQFDWRTCGGDISVEIADSGQLKSTLRSRLPAPFGSQFRCVCNNSIGIALSHSANFIFQSMLFAHFNLLLDCHLICLTNFSCNSSNFNSCFPDLG